MSRIFFIISGIITACCGQAMAQSNPNLPPCYQDKVMNTNGSAIRLGSGQVFEAYPGSSNKLAFWLPLDKVTVCYLGGSAVQITDLKNKQTIKALRK